MAYYPIELLGWIIITLLTIEVVYSILNFVYTLWLGALLGLNMDLRKCGPWAVVTGSTDGIGKCFAKRMAAKGLNVVLISRTQTKLDETANEIRAQYGSVQVKTIAVDFTESQSIYPKLKQELSELEIGILINNVGMTSVKRFDQMTEEKIQDIINVNVMSMARMCHIVLPQMIQRKKGVIINVGSLSCAVAAPLYSVYAGTKAFVDKFSLDLAAEVRSKGITVQALHPGYVRTKLAPLKRAKYRVPDADTYTDAALRTLGLEQRTAGFPWHKFLLFAFTVVNFYVPRHYVEDFLVKKTIDIRNRTVQQLKSESKRS